MAGCTQYSAVPTGCNVPTRPRVGLLDRASSEDSLLLDENRAGLADFTNGSLYDLAGLISDSRTLVRRATDMLDQLNRNPPGYLFGDHDQGVPIK